MIRHRAIPPQLVFRFALACACLLCAPAPCADQAIYFYQRGYVAGGESASTQLTDAAVEGFSRAHPGIKVVVVGVPWDASGDLKLRAVLLNRRKIDVFRVTNDQLPAFIPSEGELLSPIDPHLTAFDREDIAPATLEALRHGGRIMAWPLWSTALALIGNREIIAERGVDLPKPGQAWKWDEFTAVLTRATFERADGRNVWGLTAAARPPFFEWSPLLWVHSGPIFLPPSERIDGSEMTLSPRLPGALTRVAELVSRKIVSPGFGTEDQITAQQLFRSGRASFILSSPAFVRTLAGLDLPYVILPPPTGDWGAPITTGALGCFAVVAHPGDESRTRAGHEFARYLTSARIAEDVPGWYLAAPARRSVTSFWRRPEYAGLESIARTAVTMKAPGGAGFIERTLIPKLQAALLGELEPEQAVREIERAYKRRRLR